MFYKPNQPVLLSVLQFEVRVVSVEKWIFCASVGFTVELLILGDPHQSNRQPTTFFAGVAGGCRFSVMWDSKLDFG